MDKRTLVRTVFIWVFLALVLMLAFNMLGREEDGSGALAAWLPVALIAVLVFLFLLVLGRARGVQGNVFKMLKTRARLLPEQSKARFSDVGGCREAKERLADVVDFLKAPKPWLDAGARLPRGVLLEGPPGCGKTLLARAVAGEAKVKFFAVNASEFVEMFVGVGAARVRDTFETAAKQAPAVIFVDELDAVGRRRGSGIGSSHDEREQTVNQILANMDGFELRSRVVVLAATNRADILDKALLRPGRFDLVLHIAPPDKGERHEILGIHAKGKKLGADVSLASLAERTEGMHGAHLEHLVNEAALRAVRRTRADGGGPAVLVEEDFAGVLAAGKRDDVRFDKLDAALLESVTQLARPTGKVNVRVVQRDGGAVVDGDLVWVDAVFLKVRRADGTAVVVPKAQVQALEALEGTEVALAEDLKGDPWSGRTPDVG